MTVLGCIADDFTGACDLASLLQRSGAEVSLRIGVPQTLARHTQQAVEINRFKNVVVLPPDDARMVALNALKWLQQAGAERFYFKYCSTFDSTPQGNIGVIGENADVCTGGKIRRFIVPRIPHMPVPYTRGHMFVGGSVTI